MNGWSLIGPDTPYAYVDGVHPNDYGFWMMAEGLAPVLRPLLAPLVVYADTGTLAKAETVLSNAVVKGKADASPPSTRIYDGRLGEAFLPLGAEHTSS